MIQAESTPHYLKTEASLILKSAVVTQENICKSGALGLKPLSASQFDQEASEKGVRASAEKKQISHGQKKRNWTRVP